MVKNGMITGQMVKFPFINKNNDEIRQVALNRHLLMLSN
jgi:hypothetical protein